MIAVELNNVSKNTNGIEVLNNISLSLESSGIYGIVGDNFSGRLELLKIISGIMREHEGEVKIFGSVLAKKTGYNDDIGMSFGISGFIEEYSAYKNLKILSSIKGKIDNMEVKDALSTVELLSLSRDRVREFNLSMKKRLSIAQAIMEKPKLLIIDEPFMYLTQEEIENIKLVFKDINRRRDTTVILGCRSAEYIDDICEDIYNIRNGKIEDIKTAT
ncbi:ATP-binding cassette domain-containing protein [Clostridium cylindrosporum]|uniref:ABC-type multidrug transport system, ATPase component n=1 Tax=Clostridium cylindrosporum DSM 605 TaxID=1121307 RepID=A0A0J8DD44_CLOCY|nr:ATP-binding cassette domain-containing protein [Clostridium cylindrosporum]KMT22168.1 ABC-type multidrug transport system, ATPase component [Clostridium cylindrosporum DSM 605]